MSEEKAEQYVKFRRWLRRPNPQIEKPPLTDDMAGMKTYLEDVMWEVWQAGYSEALGDAQAVFAERAREIRSQRDSMERELYQPGVGKGRAHE